MLPINPPRRIWTRASFLVLMISSCLALLVTQFHQATADGDHPWCYDDEKCSPAHWGGICKTGQTQSPIDLQPDKTIKASKLRHLKINHNYREIQPNFFIKNNGHTIQVQLRENMTSSSKIASDGLRGLYQFSQMHFHWGAVDQAGSEHTVNGFSYAMELHMVHFSDRYENILAAVADQNPKALAVVGIFFTATKNDNPALTPIVDAIQQVVDYYPDPLLVESQRLNLSAFFPDILDVFRYDGSLTTPSCAEKVIWTVFRQPVPISERQLAVFRRIRDQLGNPLVNNFRPTQPVARRRVMESVVMLSEIQSDNEIDTSGSGDTGSQSKNIHGHGSDTHEHEEDDDLKTHDAKTDNDEKKSAASSFITYSFHSSITFVVGLGLAAVLSNYISTSSSFKMFEPI